MFFIFGSINQDKDSWSSELVSLKPDPRRLFSSLFAVTCCLRHGSGRSCSTSPTSSRSQLMNDGDVKLLNVSQWIQVSSCLFMLFVTACGGLSSPINHLPTIFPVTSDFCFCICWEWISKCFKEDLVVFFIPLYVSYIQHLVPVVYLPLAKAGLADFYYFFYPECCVTLELQLSLVSFLFLVF